jgi:signal transduction protein with GAF and PtsI domain
MLQTLSPALQAILTIAGPILVALVTGWWSYAAGRRKTAVEATAANSGFSMLVTKLQEERVELTKIVDRQADIMEEQSAKISRLEGEVRKLQRHIDRLEKTMMKHDLDLPSPPNEG